MRFSACITTRNAAKELNICLKSLWNSSIKPDSVIVSDDSPTPEVQQQNRQVIEQYPGTTYIKGPQQGVNANRNCAVNAIANDIDLVAFIDDDIAVAPDFISTAINQYMQMPPEEQRRTFITGGLPTKLSFRGYYRRTGELPQCVNIHAAVFPRRFFDQEQWEEEIYFGQGDAILCLRALRRGYRILSCPELRVRDLRPGQGTLATQGKGKLTDYDLHQHAARLYIGIKRYKELFPNPVKLTAFLALYFGHTSVYLCRNGALDAWKLILQRSHFRKLWHLSSSS